MPSYPAGAHIPAPLCDHLQMSNFADSFVGVKDKDPDSIDAGKPLQIGFPRIPRSGDENDQFVLFRLSLEGGDKQTGHNLQGHVFKGLSRAMSELQYGRPVL